MGIILSPQPLCIILPCFLRRHYLYGVPAGMKTPRLPLPVMVRRLLNRNIWRLCACRSPALTLLEHSFRGSRRRTESRRIERGHGIPETRLHARQAVCEERLPVLQMTKVVDACILSRHTHRPSSLPPLPPYMPKRCSASQQATHAKARLERGITRGGGIWKKRLQDEAGFH